MEPNHPQHDKDTISTTRDSDRKDKKPLVSGSCACTATKWSSTHLPTRSSFCHCTICQKISGGSFIAFMDLPFTSVTFTSTPVSYSTSSTLKTMSVSKNAERGFCTECGSTLTMKYFATPDVVYLTLSSVDLVDRGVLEGLVKKHLYVKDLGRWDKLPDDSWPRWETMPNEGKYLGTSGGE